MVATGLTSSPAPVDFLGSADFHVPIINFGSFQRETDRILQYPAIKHVTVHGAGKAAHDTVYLLAAAGKRVTWIVRASGHGPVFMAPAHIYVGLFLCWLEMLPSDTFFSWFSPCVWGDADGFGYIRSLLHGTRVGRCITDNFWKKLETETIEQAGLNEHERLENLKPFSSVFWYSTGLAILNYPTSLYALVTSGQIEVV